MSLIPPVVLRASGKHTATLIFLHGLGDTGFGWAGGLNTIKPPYLKVICPTAPQIPVTLNGGAYMPAWYDLLSLEPGEKREDLEGVKWAMDYLHQLVKAEIDRGVDSDRVMIGGFSQGGAVALGATLSHPTPLAGCLALSCYLPGGGALTPEKPNIDTPIWQAHGDSDMMVPWKMGNLTAEIVEKIVKEHHFVTYKGMDHEAWQEELDDIKAFINKKLDED